MQSSNNELPVEQWNQRGQQLLNLRRYEEAIEYFDKAIEICNNSRAKEEFSLDREYELYRSWRLQGICFYELKRYREATKRFQNTIDVYQNIQWFIKNANHTESQFIKPWYIADVWYENGLCFSNLEDYEEANRCFDKAIEEDSNFGMLGTIKA